MGIHVFGSKKAAAAFCRKKNKHARKYRWVYMKMPKGGYGAYKRKK